MPTMSTAPFLGSLPSPEFESARLSRLIDAGLSLCALIGGGAVWLGAWADGGRGDGWSLLGLSSAVLLSVAVIGLLLWHLTTSMPRLAISYLLHVIGRRVGLRVRRQAVELPPGQRAAVGLPALVDAIAGRMLAPEEPGDIRPPYESAVRDGRLQARQIVKTLFAESDALAAAVGIIQATGSRLTTSTQQASTACEEAQDSLAGVTNKVVTLTSAVSATAVDIRRSSAVAIALSDQALTTQKVIADLDDRSAVLTASLAKMSRVVSRIGALGQEAAVRAAQSGEAGRGLAPIAAGIQELSAGVLAAVATMQTDIATMSAEVAEAVTAAQDIMDSVKSQQEIGLGLSHSVTQQTEEIAAILQLLGKTRKGFSSLQASVEAVARHATARLEQVEELQEAANRLPQHADLVAGLLRDIPDFAPSAEFDF